MNECPRCLNNNLKEDYKYCPICGIELGTAPEVPVQEQLENIYPVQMCIVNKVNDGITVIDENTIIESSQAIKIEIKIDDNRYNKSQVYESIKIACQKLLKCYL